VEGNFVLTGPEERTPVTLGARDLEKVEVLDRHRRHHHPLQTVRERSIV
jgi:hypothetical protein